MTDLHPPSPLQAPVGPRPVSRFYQSQRLRLHWLDWGDPAAPTLVLLHGGMDHAHSWDAHAARWSRDFHVVAPDLRGHGESDWSPDGHYSPAAHLYDLVRLLDEVGKPQVDIVAHSFGGMIAARCAGLYPDRVRRLVLVEGLGPPPAMAAARAALSAAERLRAWVDAQHDLARRTPRAYATVDEAVERMRRANPRLSAETARHLTNHGLRRREDGRYVWKYDNHVRPVSPIDFTPAELHALWTEITAPVLILHGAQSFVPDPRPLPAPFADAAFAWFTQSGHWLQHDEPKLFHATVSRFLAGEDRGTSGSGGGT